MKRDLAGKEENAEVVVEDCWLVLAHGVDGPLVQNGLATPIFLGGGGVFLRQCPDSVVELTLLITLTLLNLLQMLSKPFLGDLGRGPIANLLLLLLTNKNHAYSQ